MKSIIIATAGHIDHGKTALVKALTGIDADRLAEEKRRGITIDLGFAHMELPTLEGETLRIGFVDVPGHERFVRNMLAGVGGIDLVLLVISADESIRPQTREHFDILQLLGVHRRIAVITKADAVDAETLHGVRLEVEEFLSDGTRENAGTPIIAVSALTGMGLDDLRTQLLEESKGVEPRDATAIARLPIDRVFTMKGFGTVATGTLIAGTIRVEEELEILPSAQRVRVRGLQVHGHPVKEAHAGQRTAVNLAGVTTDELARGMTLVPPSTLTTTRQADVRLRLLPSASPLKNRSRVYFYSHTKETLAEIVLQQRVKGGRVGRSLVHKPDDTNGPLQAGAGEEWNARIKLSESALLLPMDRFILRQLSPAVTIGGGTVTEIAILPKRKETIPYAGLNEPGEPQPWALGYRVARRGGDGITLTRLIAETGRTADHIESELSPLLAKGLIARSGNLLLHFPALEASCHALTAALLEFHKNNPLVAGMSKEVLREKLKLNAEAFAAVLGHALGQKKLVLAGDLAKLPGAGVVLKDEEAESKKNIELAFSSAGLKAPALTEVLAGLKIDKTRAHKIVTLLLRERVLVKISEDLIFHRTALDQLRMRMAAHRKVSSRIDVAKFKELTGVTRKYAIPLLEYLDRERVTKRVGDAREIL
ncbi:MAG TPA: selenocysteine-specific translation elongation factor [Candidatus Sulfotelmatobacter sp.]|jgi:selenocysteine-specific elongation factor